MTQGLHQNAGMAELLRPRRTALIRFRCRTSAG